MSEHDESVVESAETTTTPELEDNSNNYEETNSPGEGEATQEGEGGEQHPTRETPEQKVARLKRQLKRAERNAGEESEEGSKEGDQEGSQKESHQKKEEVKDDRFEALEEKYQRLELKAEGITSKKEQDVVLDYAEYKGIDLETALKTPAVKAEIKELGKKKSTPAPSKRTGTGATDSFEYWAAQAKKGNFPKDPEMMDRLKKARIFTS